MRWRSARDITEATAVVCSCGHRLACEVARLGERLGFVYFLDDEPDSDTRAERVRDCPGCGLRLGLLALVEAKPCDQPG